jgi:MFS family permease
LGLNAGSAFIFALLAFAAFIFALLAFAAGFIVRPFGAIFFGRLGDMIGRKYTFLVTILIMGLWTFIVVMIFVRETKDVDIYARDRAVAARPPAAA